MGVVLLATAAAGLIFAPTLQPKMPALALRMNADEDVMNWCLSTDRRDAALTVSGARNAVEALRDFWFVTRSLGTQEGASQYVLAFGGWPEAMAPEQFLRFVNHINLCSECSDLLGENLLCSSRHPGSAPQDGEPAAPLPMLVLRKFASGTSSGSADEAAYFGEVDPFADLEARLGGESVEQKQVAASSCE